MYLKNALGITGTELLGAEELTDEERAAMNRFKKALSVRCVQAIDTARQTRQSCNHAKTATNASASNASAYAPTRASSSYASDNRQATVCRALPQ